MIAGQKVKKNRRPGPMGFGLGSGHQPRAAKMMIAHSGPDPRTRRPRPTRTHPGFR
jgi:hypothetical protein